MTKRHPGSGSTATACIFALFLTLLTALTVYFFVAKTWWFPEPINVFGREIDAQFMRTLYITGIVFILSQLALAWAIFRFRDRGQRAGNSHGNNTMEFLWTGATIILFVGLGVYGRTAWAQLHFTPAGPGALQVEATGKQFAWNFRYPGPDGIFGRTDPKLIDDSVGNPLGLDPTDPAGKDDVVVPIMAVPVNRQIEVLLRAQDVTHALFFRELRLKQDAVPGMTIRIHFTAEKTGRFEIACAELCGLGHQRMRSFLEVKPPAEFENWLREQAAAATQE